MIDPQRLDDLKTEIQGVIRQLDLDSQREELVTLETAQQDPSFWQREGAPARAQRAERLREVLSFWDALLSDLDATTQMVAASIQEGESSLEKELSRSTDDLVRRFEIAKQALLFRGEHDDLPAIVTLAAGAGGADAQDWTEMLLRMYLRYAELKGWKAQLLDSSAGGEAGLKSATLRIQGERVYGHFKAESGVHRLVRLSPFNADSLRQTSFALVDVVPEMVVVEEMQIPESDLRIDVFRAGGKGGQSVNTTDSAVRIVHIPSGITVSCQNERSQLQNKATAMRVLQSRLLAKQRAEQDAAKQKLRGNVKSAAWGEQIRSYVLHPYQMVKDHRTDVETSDTTGVLDGDLDQFVLSWLQIGIHAKNQ